MYCRPGAYPEAPGPPTDPGASVLISCPGAREEAPMAGEPPAPCPPAANADDDATSNPAAHNKLIFVIDGVPLFCRKRPAFLIKPKRQIGFCSNWDCGMLSPWNYRPVRNPKVCARVGRPRRVGVVVQGCRYVRWRNSIKRLINPTTMH